MIDIRLCGWNTYWHRRSALDRVSPTVRPCTNLKCISLYLLFFICRKSFLSILEQSMMQHLRCWCGSSYRDWMSCCRYRTSHRYQVSFNVTLAHIISHLHNKRGLMTYELALTSATINTGSNECMSLQNHTGASELMY